MVNESAQLPKRNKRISIHDIESVIRDAKLSDLRVLDLQIKERRREIVESGLELFEPPQNLTVNTTRGNSYLYLHKKVSGKTVSRVLKATEIDTFDFSVVKISERAKQFLFEKYGRRV